MTWKVGYKCNKGLGPGGELRLTGLENELTVTRGEGWGKG